MSVAADSPMQFYPSLDAATEAALRASIERFGVLVPVVVTQHGQILDGHHRSRIAESLGVEYERRVCEVAGLAEAREISRTLNEDRRMLTMDQRLPVVAALREEGHSTRAIAGALGVDHSTVVRDTKRVGGADAPPVTGLDGKTYPAKKFRPDPKPEGRRTYRKVKDIPFRPASVKQSQIASAHKRRLGDGLAGINGICRGLRDLDLGIAAAACTADELKTWIAKTSELSRSLADLKRRLTEVSDGKA